MCLARWRRLRTKVRRILGWSIGALTVVALAVAAWYFTLGPGDVTPWLIEAGWEEDPDAPLTATGLLEGIEVTLSAELSGRVERVYVGEGDPIEAGDLLLALDSTLLESQLAETEAGIAVARAALAQAEAGVRSEQIEQAEALLLQAVAARDGAYQAYLDAQAMRSDPQELDDQIDRTRTQVAVASHQVMEAVAIKDAVELLRDNADWVLDQIEAGYVLSLPLPNGGIHDIRLKKMDASGLRTSLEYQWWYAWTLVNTAGAGRDGAQNALDELLRVRQSPRELDAAVAEARGRYESAVATVEMAQANLAALQGGATPEQLDAVRAQIGEAEAAKTLVQAQLAKTLCWLLDSSMGIRGTSQADVRSHSGFSRDGSIDSAQAKGRKGHRQRVFSVGFRPLDNLGCAINNPLEA